MPVNKKPEFVPIDQRLSVPWQQADYFNIITALYNGVLRKSLQGWQLHNMDFRSSCNNIEEGFQNGRFEFFSVTNEKENESRTSRFIDIDTRGKFVHIKESEYYPKVVDWSAIDIDELKISADQAFEIAERNGGK